MNNNAIKEYMLHSFKEIYGANEGTKVFFAPGRVNLIGEHTDYNGGYVFPCALSIGTYAAVRLREDNEIRLFSLNFPEVGIISLKETDMEYQEEHDWANYPKGMFKILKDKGYDISGGMDILYYGNIPNGAGLSSSASIEVLTGYMLKDMFGLDFDMVSLAIYSRQAENEYIGVNCGIMDQFAVAMGWRDKAIFLNTATLEYSYAPLELGDYKILIMNTNKRRGLKDSKYNERRQECEAAFKIIVNEMDKLHISTDEIKGLCQLSLDDWNLIKDKLEEDTLYKRAKHAVMENIRTVEAQDVLKQGAIEEFGKLMTASHMSLKADYEVTGIELDTLVEAALSCEGVIGARMTGAGFGGCAIALVKECSIQDVITSISKIYTMKTGLTADFYSVNIGSGPCEVIYD